MPTCSVKVNRWYQNASDREERPFVVKGAKFFTVPQSQATSTRTLDAKISEPDLRHRRRGKDKGVAEKKGLDSFRMLYRSAVV
jgi:hypothetical protein